MNKIIEEQPDMRVTGSLLSWNSERGFGFVEASLGGRHIFMHIDDVVGQTKTFSVGQKISYIQSTDMQGRACALSIIRDGESPQKTSSNKRGMFKFALVFGIILILGISIWLNTFDVRLILELWLVEAKQWLFQVL